MATNILADGATRHIKRYGSGPIECTDCGKSIRSGQPCYVHADNDICRCERCQLRAVKGQMVLS